MEVELMVTKRDDDRPTNRQGEYRAICLLKVGRQSFAKSEKQEERPRLNIDVKTICIYAMDRIRHF